MVQSVLSSKTEIRHSETDGKGTFAKEDIKKGEMVYIRGGHILTQKDLFFYETEDAADGYWPLSDDYFWGQKPKTNLKAKKFMSIILAMQIAGCAVRLPV